MITGEELTLPEVRQLIQQIEQKYKFSDNQVNLIVMSQNVEIFELWRKLREQERQKLRVRKT